MAEWIGAQPKARCWSQGWKGKDDMPAETYTLMGLGLAGVVIAWLIFSVFKKILGLVFLGALAFGAWIVWNNPQMLGPLGQMLGLR